MSQTDASANRAAFERALELGEEGERLAAAGKYQTALPVLAEAMRLHRSISGPHPAMVSVAATLNNLGFCLSRVKQYGAAVGALQEARQLCEPMWQAAQQLDVLRLLMAQILGALGYSLAMLGEFEAAVEPTQNLVRLRRSLLEPGPVQIDFDLGKDLRLFALVRARTKVDGEQANTAICEAVAIFQLLAKHEPAHYTRELITTLDVYAEVLESRGQHDDAALVRGQLVDEYESLAKAMEQGGRHAEAAAIRSYSASLASKA